MPLAGVVVGIIALFGGVCLGILGKHKLDEYEATTVTVRVEKVVDKTCDLNIGPYGTQRYTHYTFNTTADYVAHGRPYPFDLAKFGQHWDWADGETFQVYFTADSPSETVTSRPYARLLIGGATALAGLAIIAFAVLVGDGSEGPLADRPLRRA